jgi:hypothetical protein
MIDAIQPALPSTLIPSDEQTATVEEIKQVIRKGGNNKAPGPDGIGTTFYKENWETVKDDLCDLLNQMMLHETDTQQNQGIIVCLPKPKGTQTPEGYRPVTLLNRLQDSGENHSTPYKPGDGQAAREPILWGTREQHL